jgi:teichuronic acid biosynthesis glycosyltransferase TuaG
MIDSSPIVSIIIPTYNQDRYIRFCIDSCLSQTYRNLEIIVVDDGSTDETPKILASYGEKIKVITQKNQGAAKALNNGIRESSGIYIGWLSSDDAFLPEKISLQVKHILGDISIDLIYTDWFSIDSNGKVLKEVKSPYFKNDFLKHLLFGNFINGSSILMKKIVWEEVGGFNSSLIADVDGFMWYKLLIAGKKFCHIPQTLIFYRTHNQNQSSNKPLMRHFSDLVILDTLQSAPDSLFNAGRGNEGLYDFYGSLRKHLNTCFFWKSSLFVSKRMNIIQPSLSDRFQIIINKLFIYLFNADQFTANKRIEGLFRLRGLALKVYHYFRQ